MHIRVEKIRNNLLWWLLVLCTVRATPLENVSGRFHIVLSHSSWLNHHKHGHQVLHIISVPSPFDSMMNCLPQSTALCSTRPGRNGSWVRRSVGQSVSVSGTRLGPATNSVPFSLIIFRRLRVCWCGAPSLMRGRVCSCQVFAGHRQRNLSQIYFTVSFETPPTWRAGFLYLFPPGTGWPSYTPGHCLINLHIIIWYICTIHILGLIQSRLVQQIIPYQW
jgi:hypothetical protein